MEKLTVLCVLLAAVGLAVTEDAYFKADGNLTLDVSPPYPDPIKNILWKFNGNLLAEWIKDKVPVEFYRSFIGRSTLDTGNGRLVVTRMSTADMGVYSVEINSNVQSVSFTAKLINVVPKPEAVIKPLICTSSSEVCNVSCDGDTTDAEPVTYWWKMGAGKWKEGLGKNIEITDIKNVQDENFTCKMTNPVSEQVSATIDNPFYREDKPEKSSTAGTVISVLAGLALVPVAVAVAVGVRMWKSKKCPFQNRGPHRTDTEDKPANQPEDVPLKGNPPA